MSSDVIEIFFLGTSSSTPTPRRGLPAIAMLRKGELFFFDFGEGAQRNLIRAGIGLNRKTKIFISHLHADHIFGIPGILQTMSLMKRKERIDIYGPKGTKDFLNAIMKTVHFNLTFPVMIHEVEEGLIYKGSEYEVRSVVTKHSELVNLSYAFIESERPGEFNVEKARALGIPEGPLWGMLQRGMSIELEGKIIKPSDVLGPPRRGRKIVYSGDCRPSDKLIELAKDADILIHESTFDDEYIDRAIETGHSTSSEAAFVAKRANVKMLVLTHLSARYKEPDVLLKQAKSQFENTIVAEDMMKIILPLEGEPKIIMPGRV